MVTTNPIGHGTGLGLSMCYGTVKEHSGKIYAQSLDPHGAAVTIELPANKAHSRAASAPQFRWAR